VLQIYKRDIRRFKTITFFYAKTLLASNKQEIGYLIFKDLSPFNAFIIYTFQNQRYINLSI